MRRKISSRIDISVNAHPAATSQSTKHHSILEDFGIVTLLSNNTLITIYLVQSYNGLGQLYQERQRRIDGSVTDYAYDSQGRLVMSTLPYISPATPRSLGTSYDALGWPLSVETRDGELFTNTRMIRRILP